MYPPRKSGQSNSRSKNGSGYVSPGKETTKVNRVIEHAKKYQASSNSNNSKRDYMLEGIMSIKKKNEEQQQTGKRRVQAQNIKQQQQRYVYRQIDRDNSKSNSINTGNFENQFNRPSEIQQRDAKRQSYIGKAQNQYKYQSEEYQRQNKLIRQSDKVTNQRNINQTNNFGSNKQYQMANQNLNDYRNQNQGDLQAYRRNNYSQKYQVQTKHRNNQQYENRQALQIQQKVQKNQNYQTQQQQTTLNDSKQLSRVTSQPQIYSSSSRQQAQRNLNQGYQQKKVSTTAITNSYQQINKNNNDQGYMNKPQSGQIKFDQNRNIQVQIDKMISEANQMRSKLYRAEDERAAITQKYKLIQQQMARLRSQNEQNKIKARNSEFEILSLQNYKSMAENQIKDIKSNKQAIYNELMSKMNEVTIQNRKKSIQIARLERVCSELQAQLGQRNHELNRLKQVVNKKQEQFLNLQQKQYQHNKNNNAQSKLQFQIKSCHDKILRLQQENTRMKQQKSSLGRLELETSKYKKQINQMLQDMKDLESQLQAKDKVILQYKSYNPQEVQDTRVKMVSQQLEVILKQKAELARSYEQKILQKEKRIAQLQTQNIGKANISNLKLTGVEAGQAAFEQILKQQLQQINIAKRQNTEKVNQSLNLKIQLENMRSELQNQRNKCKILSLQLQSSNRNANSIAQSHLRAAKNQIDSLNRRIQIMNNTIQSKRKQNLNKDEFIKQYLIGTNKSSDTTLILNSLQKIMSKQT